MAIKILGALLNPTEGENPEYIPRGEIIFDDQGLIQSYGEHNETATPPCEITLDYSDYLITPGFVDCHCHIAQARAVNVRYAELLTWLDRVIFPLESEYDDLIAASEAPRFFHHLLSTGTTTAGLYVTVSEEATNRVFEEAKTSGIRAVIGKVMMDRFSPDSLIEDTTQSVAASIRLAEKWDGQEKGRLHYAFTPRFALTCSMKLMSEAAKAAKERDCRIMTHVAENKGEVVRAAELFPESRSYLDIYHQAGLLSEKTIFGHGIYLEDADWEIMAETGATIAHCPIANLLLESGILDLSKPKQYGVPVGLGSDIGAGSEPALFEVAEAAVTSQISRKVLDRPFLPVSPQYAFYLMTLGGAKALALGDTIGDFTPGKQADLVVLDPRECLPLKEWPKDIDAPSILYALMLRFRVEAVKAAFVSGAKIFERNNNNA